MHKICRRRIGRLGLVELRKIAITDLVPNQHTMPEQVNSYSPLAVIAIRNKEARRTPPLKKTPVCATVAGQSGDIPHHRRRAGEQFFAGLTDLYDQIPRGLLLRLITIE